MGNYGSSALLAKTQLKKGPISQMNLNNGINEEEKTGSKKLIPFQKRTFEEEPEIFHGY